MARRGAFGSIRTRMLRPEAPNRTEAAFSGKGFPPVRQKTLFFTHAA